MSTDRVSFLAFSCPHCPLHDRDTIAKLIGRIEEIQPDVIVHLGDGHEADGASKFDSEYDFDLLDEFEAHNDFLAQIRKVSRKSRKVFLPGNHDANLQEWNRIDKRLRTLCDYRDHEPELEHWEQPCQYIYDKRRGVFRLGPVSFGHGYEHGQNGDEFQALLLGVPFGLHVTGHTHRPTPMVQRCYRTKAVPLPYWFANPGCLREMKPKYMERKRSHQWGHGFVTGETPMLKSPRMSRMWEARVEIFKMADDGDFD